MLIVHHDDPEREWAYEQEVDLSPLDEALRLAPGRGWHVISMRNDFATIYATNEGTASGSR